MKKLNSTDHASNLPTDANSAMLAPNTMLELVIPWTIVDPAYQKVSRKVAQRVKIDGFRKGKVPTQLAKQVVNQDRVVELTLEAVVPPAYVALINQHQKQPIGNPEFHPEAVEVGQDWMLHVHIAEKPIIKLGDWKKVAKTAKEQYQKKKVELEKEKTTKPTAVSGTKPSDKTALNEAEKARSDELGMIYGALVTTIRPQIPQLLVKQEATSQLRQLGEQLERFNLTFEAFLASRKITQEQLTSQVTAEALGRLQLVFIISAIVEELKLQPTATELEKELEEKTKEMQDYYQTNTDARAALKNRVAQQKTEAYLLAL